MCYIFAYFINSTYLCNVIKKQKLNQNKDNKKQKRNKEHIKNRNGKLTQNPFLTGNDSYLNRERTHITVMVSY